MHNISRPPWAERARAHVTRAAEEFTVALLYTGVARAPAQTLTQTLTVPVAARC